MVAPTRSSPVACTAMKAELVKNEPPIADGQEREVST